jgi:hypothetical protein
VQRIQILASDDGSSHFLGLTPEGLSSICERVSGPAAMSIIDAPSFQPASVSQGRELIVIMSGVHDFGTNDGVRRLFPGDIIVLEDDAGQGHTLETVGIERAISLHFPISLPSSR